MVSNSHSLSPNVLQNFVLVVVVCCVGENQFGSCTAVRRTTGQMFGLEGV